MQLSVFPLLQYCAFVYTRALALNCNAPVNDKDGAEAKNWKAGKPVRVIRSCKGRKHSKYSPEEGNRYDGIYKVCGHNERVSFIVLQRMFYISESWL